VIGGYGDLGSEMKMKERNGDAGTTLVIWGMR